MPDKKNNSSEKMKQNTPITFIIIIAVFSVVVVVLGYFALFNKTKTSTENPNTLIHKNTSYSSDAYSPEQIAKDKNALDSMIVSIKNYRPSNVNNIADILNEVYKFRGLIDVTNSLSQKYSTDTAFTNNINTMLNLMKQKQIQYFPVFRVSYSKVANRLMSADGILTAISGNNSTTLELIGDKYSDSTNTKIDFDILCSHLELLRYKQLVFKTQSENKIVKTYSIKSIDDSSQEIK